MASAIIHHRGPQVQVLSDVVPTIAWEGGFDGASAEVCYRGSYDGLRSHFAPGSGGPGANMICKGVQATRNRFGHIWATVEWVGFWDAIPDPAIGYDYSRRETIFPLQYGAGNWLYYQPPGGGAPPTQRTRYLDIVGAVTAQGWFITTGTAPPPPPVCPITTKPPGMRNLDYSGIPDPLIAEPGFPAVGKYDLVDYTETSKAQYGNKVLRQWSAKWEWVEKYNA